MNKWIVFLFMAAMPVCFASQNYVVNFDKVEQIALPMGNELVVDYRNLKIINRARYLNGTMAFLRDMNNDDYQLSAELFVSPMYNGDYKKLAMGIPPTGVCEAFSKFFRDFLQPSIVYGVNSNLPHVDESGLCPLPKGEYFFKDFSLNTDSFPSHVPRGLIKCELIYYQDHQVVGGIVVYASIENNVR